MHFNTFPIMAHFMRTVPSSVIYRGIYTLRAEQDSWLMGYENVSLGHHTD